MNNNLFSLFCVLLVFLVLAISFSGCAPTDQQELKVLQLNIWQEGSMVPDGMGGIVAIIAQTSPDVVFLCEIRNYNDQKFMPRLLSALHEQGLNYYGKSLDMSVGILSKYKIENSQSAFTLENKSRPMIKATITVNGQNVALYSAHLDYTHYECYLPRGYSGTTWEKIEAPVTDVAYIIEANRVAYRDEAIAAFIKDASTEIEKGNIVIMGGDFNEPSHLDWQENTKKLWDHNGIVIDWDCSMKLTEAGYKDSYREIYPDPVHYPGFTFPAANEDVDISKLTWAPEVDERDRIDFIYYYPVKGLKLKDAKIVGPSGSVYYGKMGPNDAEDEFIEPLDSWPTDHKGNVAVFTITLPKD